MIIVINSSQRLFSSQDPLLESRVLGCALLLFRDAVSIGALACWKITIILIIYENQNYKLYIIKL